MRSGSTAEELLERGVHLAAYRLGGDRVLLAITSSGELLRRVRLRPGVNEQIARAFLQGLIDHDDPERPRLHLVSPATSSRAAPRVWRFWLPRLRRETGIP